MPTLPSPLTPPSVMKSYCNACSRDTKHDVLHVEDQTESDDEFGIWSSDTYRMLKCRGCDAVHLRREYRFSEDCEPDGTLITTVTLYPPAISRRTPSWISDIRIEGDTDQEITIKELLSEIYTALQNGLPRLAAMGIRALVESVMIEKCGDTGVFGRNLDAFLKEGYIAQKEVDTFRNALIEAGHAAMHRGYKPTDEDLSTIIDIVERLIETIYIHPIRAARTAKGIPRRS